MGSASEDRDLGMGRPIARRDFLNGIAVGVAGACAASASDGQCLRGRSSAAPRCRRLPAVARRAARRPSSLEDFDGIRAGAFARASDAGSDTREDYDLVSSAPAFPARGRTSGAARCRINAS
jgi:spermidine dehydrogenase